MRVSEPAPRPELVPERRREGEGRRRRRLRREETARDARPPRRLGHAQSTRRRARRPALPRQRRVLGIPRVDLHAPAARRPAQGWRRTDRSPQTSVAPYVWRTPPYLANGRNAVKPGLFCEHSGRVAWGASVAANAYLAAIRCEYRYPSLLLIILNNSERIEIRPHRSGTQNRQQP